MGFKLNKILMITACLVACSVGLTACNSEQGFSSGELSAGGGSGLRNGGPGTTADGIAPGEVPPDQDGGVDPVACDNPATAQVKICHIPAGNPAGKHTLCVGLSGALNGHQVKFEVNAAPGGHGGDYSGACGADPASPGL
jgi:predicted small secreted protein